MSGNKISKERKDRLILFFIILILIQDVEASITTNAVLEIKNQKPVIDSIKFIDDNLEISVKDSNGYKDITEVMIISGNFTNYAELKTYNNDKATYTIKLPGNIKNGFIEVKDKDSLTRKEFIYNKEENILSKFFKKLLKFL